MIIRRHRSHNVQPEQYESMNFGAFVEVDTEVDDGYQDVGIEEIERKMSALLDDLLVPEVDRALSLGGHLSTSHHLNDFYPEN